ncbi:MAG: DUF4190 domain-containing protein [Mycobacterium sp.]
MTAPPRGLGPRNGFGTAALVVAVGGLLICWSVVGGIACGVVAVIFGVLGRGRATRGEANNGAVATAGTALGALAIVASVAFAVIWWSAWRDSDGSEYLDCVVRSGTDQRALDGCRDSWLDNIQKEFGVTLQPPSPTSQEST